MRSFARMKAFERDIEKENEKVPIAINNLLKMGYALENTATYLCSACQEWQVGYYPYVLEKTKVSPYGTIRGYTVHYIDGVPKCKKCGKDLIFLLNPKSSKNRCPKCGTDNVKVKFAGYFD